MARVTVEDCLDFVENRFELVMLASRRARQLAEGRAEPLVPRNNDKPTVLALREIATGQINKKVLDAVESEPSPEETLFVDVEEEIIVKDADE